MEKPLADLRKTGSIAVSLVAIDEYSPEEAQLLARIVF